MVDTRHGIRNMSVIAHVDHGKSTLSDFLLAKGQELNVRRAGDARAMDTDQQEIDRGITINSTGAQIVFKNWTITPKSLPNEPLLVIDSSLYVGNLPWDIKDDSEVKKLFASYGELEEVQLRPKRGFALVKFATKSEAQAALKATEITPFALDGRVLTVEPQGAGPVQALAAYCQLREANVPMYTNSRSESGFHVQVSIKSLGIQEDTVASSVKEGKRVVSEKALKRAQELEAGEAPNLVINLIDCPGHLDFNGEVSAALRITDGALVVVDPFDSKDKDSLCVQTVRVLRQALAERVKPILFLNKIDKAMLGLQLSPEDTYQRFSSVIDRVNDIIAINQPKGVDWTVSPDNGTVVFGSALMGWAFGLNSFARRLAAKSKSPESKFMKRLWGEHYFDTATNKWTSRPTKTTKRAFCAFVLEPIFKLFDASKEGDTEGMLNMAAKLNLELTPQQKEISPKDLLKLVMRKWLPAADAALEAIEHHLPSPIEAQRYRTEVLYEGPMDDPLATAMMHCDPSAEVMVYVSKLVAPPGKGGKKGLIAYGRVFAGTVKPGDSVKVLGGSYEPGSTTDSYSVKVSGLVILTADRARSASSAVAGDIVGITGIDSFVSKSGTVTSSPIAHRFKTMKFNVAPIVNIAVDLDAKSPGDSSKLVQAMQSLAKSDPTIQAYVDKETGQKILAGAGELHLDVRLRTLMEMTGMKLRASNPVVKYQETVTDSSEVCMGKTTNKHNRFYVKASPLPTDLVEYIQENGDEGDLKIDPAKFHELGLTRDDIKRVMSVHGSCMMFDFAVGMDLGPVKDHLVNAFHEVCAHGVLAAEPCRGIRFDITDAKIHSDSVHRRADQVVPAMRRVLKGCILNAAPKLLEPYFKVDMQVDPRYLREVAGALKQRRGEIIQDQVAVSGVHSVEGTLPVAKSFGFNGDIRGVSSGTCNPTLEFSHWELVPGNPVESDNASSAVVSEIRQRKKLKAAVPQPSDLLDRA